MVNFCSKCGAKQEDTDSKFCIECGASLDNKEDVKEKSVVENKTPDKVLNSININTILCPFCKKQIPINSNKCPFCGSVVNTNSNDYVGAVILGYILAILTFFSTFLKLQAILLTLVLMILTFINIAYLFSRDNDKVNTHAGIMSFLFIISLIIICFEVESIVIKLDKLLHAYSNFYY